MTSTQDSESSRMTYRERREARAERLRGWAEKRQEKAESEYDRATSMASVIPFGQPILVGHHSERSDRSYRARMGSTYERAFADQRKAESMVSRADGIEAQLASSIYSDDPDAVEQLELRIAKLEAEREQVKAHNKTHRGDKLCTCPAGCDCRSRFPRDCGCKKHPLPAYVLTNLSGNIKRNRDRLEVLKRQAARAAEADAAPDGITVADHASGYCSVTFATKPALEVRDALKAAGFYWRQGSWWGKRDALPEAVR